MKLLRSLRHSLACGFGSMGIALVILAGLAVALMLLANFLWLENWLLGFIPTPSRTIDLVLLGGFGVIMVAGCGISIVYWLRAVVMILNTGPSPWLMTLALAWVISVEGTHALYRHASVADSLFSLTAELFCQGCLGVSLMFSLWNLLDKRQTIPLAVRMATCLVLTQAAAWADALKYTLWPEWLEAVREEWFFGFAAALPAFTVLLVGTGLIGLVTHCPSRPEDSALLSWFGKKA
jgi:hypothetical protein